MEHISYPSINQYKHVHKHIKSSADYHGVPTPIVEFRGTVKIHGCVSGDTHVTMANGSTKPIRDVKVGDRVCSFNEQTQTIVDDIVTDTFVQEIDKPWCELTFDNGTTLKCTQDHPILTSTGWVKAFDLTSDHTIITDLN